VSKPYHQMSPSERLADRIAKNRQIEASVHARQGLSLDGIVAQLNARKQRATYAAVAFLVGALPRGLMSGRPRSYADSWIVAASGPAPGWPTGYAVHQIDPDCYRQICEGRGTIIEDPKKLREWLSRSE
jgi:hypothetical protein